MPQIFGKDVGPFGQIALCFCYLLGALRKDRKVPILHEGSSIPKFLPILRLVGPQYGMFRNSVLLLLCVAQEVVDWTVFHADVGRFSIKGDHPRNDGPEVEVKKERGIAQR